MSLVTFWFVVVTFFWTGFFVLEGFDFGVGMLHRFLGRSDTERRVVINTIGPWWDGNEVWLIVGGAAIFAAFPGWYATWFSAGYLALLLVLAALIIRGVSFEYRGKSPNPRWRTTWSTMLTIGSVAAPLLLGVALGDLLAGLPVGSNQEYTGNFWDLLTPYGLLTGVTLLLLCALHGATFVGIRTTGELRERARRTAIQLHAPVFVLLVVFGVSTLAVADRGALRGLVLPAIAAVAVLVGGFNSRHGKEGIAFVSTAIAIGATIVTIFVNLYPNVLISSTSSAYDLTTANTSSSHYALTVMTVVAAIFLPLVLLYQGWSFVVFRRRVATPPEPVDRPQETTPVS